MPAKADERIPLRVIHFRVEIGVLNADPDSPIQVEL